MREWRHERDEYIANALLDEQDRVEWEQQRNHDLEPTVDELRDARLAVLQARQLVELRRARNEDARLNEVAKQQAYEAWVRERDAS